MAPPPLFRRLFFCPFAHGKAAQEDWIFRIGLYLNLCEHTDEEILTFLFRSTFSPCSAYFSIHFHSIQKDGGTPSFKAAAALPVSSVTETERRFFLCASPFSPRVIQT